MVANGIVFISEGQRLVDGDRGGFPQASLTAFPEVLLLDAKTGELLKSLPLSAPGQPAANAMQYHRPAVVGDRVYIANGGHRSTGVNQPEDAFNRVLMYQLSDGDDHEGED